MNTFIKVLPKTVFAAYLIALLWLLLFKTSVDFVAVLADSHIRTLNLTLFTGHKSEIIENFAVFIPFGLLLSANFKKIAFWQKLVVIFVFSLAVEITQYVLAIGITDVTDALTNTLGGLFGLAIYRLFEKKNISSEKRDTTIAVIVALLLLFVLFLRFFVFKVKY